LYPKAKVLIWAGAWFVFRVPAWAVLGLWFLMQILNLGGGGSLVFYFRRKSAVLEQSEAT
ncbi:MAG: hypothetical protein V3T19_11075, partial [Acidiferrobacterales bacterium]